MCDILKMNRIVLITILSMLAVVVYDSLRTPAYIHNMESQDFKFDKKTLEKVYPPVPEETQEDFVSYCTINDAIQTNLEHKLPVTELYHPELVKLKRKYPVLEIPVTPPEQDYTKEKIEAIQTYLKSNHKVLQQIYDQFPVCIYFDPHMLSSDYWDHWDYKNIPRLLAADGLNAILHSNQKTLGISISALFRLTDFYTTNIHDNYPSYISNLNYTLACYTTERLTFLINSAMNRTEVSEETLVQWQEQFGAPSFLSPNMLLRALDYSNRKFLFSHQQYNQIDARASWRPLSSAMQLCGLSTRHFKIIAPEMSASFLKISQTSPEKLFILYEWFKDSEKDRKYTVYEDTTINTNAIDDYFSMSLLVAYIRTGIALYCYGQEYREFPESLQVLVPEYLDAVPMNPHDKDRQLQYKQEVDRVSIFFEEGATPFTLLKKILKKEISSTAIQEQAS